MAQSQPRSQKSQNKQTRTLRPWHLEEDDCLVAHAGSLPVRRIVRLIAAIDRKIGLDPCRTEKAIRARLAFLGLSAKCTIDNWTASELARLAGINHGHVLTWIKNGLSAKRVGAHRFLVRQKDLIKFAYLHPERMAIVKRENLLWLMEGEENIELVDRISQIDLDSRVPSVWAMPLQIKRLDTGRVFASVDEAARLCFVSSTVLRRTIRDQSLKPGQRFTACGIEFEYMGRTVKQKKGVTNHDS